MFYCVYCGFYFQLSPIFHLSKISRKDAKTQSLTSQQSAICNQQSAISHHLSAISNQHINTSTHQHINTSTHQHINTSTHQHINTSTHQHINKFSSLISNLSPRDSYFGLPSSVFQLSSMIKYKHQLNSFPGK